MRSLTAVSVLLFVMAMSAYALLENPHSFSDNDCSKCHSDLKKNPFLLADSISRLCQKCHNVSQMKASHPVDRIPELARIPGDFPLTNGMITCNTCHFIHGKRIDESGNNRHYLRSHLKGKAFCALCHEIKGADSSHGHIVSNVHSLSKFKMTDTTQPMDTISIECLNCHEGREKSFTQIGEGIWKHSFGPHPVGIKYEAKRCARKSGKLKTKGLVSQEIRFFKGRIGCGTCHNLYSKLPKKLVLTKEKLCKECHEEGSIRDCRQCHTTGYE